MIFKDRRKEEAKHYCDECFKVNEASEHRTHGLFCSFILFLVHPGLAWNIDGVTQPIVCCAFGEGADACLNMMQNNHKRFCDEHAHLENICGVILCGLPNVEDENGEATLACAEHLGLYRRWRSLRQVYERDPKGFWLREAALGRPHLHDLTRLIGKIR